MHTDDEAIFLNSLLDFYKIIHAGAHGIPAVFPDKPPQELLATEYASQEPIVQQFLCYAQQIEAENQQGVFARTTMNRMGKTTHFAYAGAGKQTVELHETLVMHGEFYSAEHSALLTGGGLLVAYGNRLEYYEQGYDLITSDNIESTIFKIKRQDELAEIIADLSQKF